jgi:hypothetical protein
METTLASSTEIPDGAKEGLIDGEKWTRGHSGGELTSAFVQ